MSCPWLPFGLLALLSVHVVDQWRAGHLDLLTAALVPVGLVLVVWTVRTASCGGATCTVPSTGVHDAAGTDPVSSDRV